MKYLNIAKLREAIDKHLQFQERLRDNLERGFDLRNLEKNDEEALKKDIERESLICEILDILESCFEEKLY